MNLSHGVVHRLKSVWHVIDQTSANFSSPPRSYNLGIEARGCQFEVCVFWGGLDLKKKWSAKYGMSSLQIYGGTSVIVLAC